MATMHTLERALHKVGEGERMLGSGSDVAEVLQHLEMTESIDMASVAARLCGYERQ